MPFGRKSNEAAFTLVEVIFSVLILAIGLLGILQGQTGATRVALRSESMAQALYLAEMKMTELELSLRQKTFESLPEEEKGEFTNETLKGFRWKRVLEKVDIGCFVPKALTQGNAEEGQTSGQGMFGFVDKIFEQAVRKIKVSVEWGEGKSARTIELVQLYVNLSQLPNF